MWALLSNPGHATGFDHLGEAYAPLRRLVEQLARREFADRVYAFQWMASFNLTTAPTSQKVGRQDGVGIEYVPDQGVFRIGYDDRMCPNSSASVLTAPPHKVGEIIDQHIQRLLLSSRRSEPEPADARAVLGLVMIVALFLVGVSVGLAFAGLPVLRLAFVSMGVASIATSLLMFSEVLRPSLVVGRSNRRPGTVVLPPNRLTFLGMALWFGAGGVAFLGYGWLTEHILPGILIAFAAGFVLAMVGGSVAQRRGEAARAVERILRAYAEQHGGWFPRGEASPEASLSLLHREYPHLVTANVLRGRTAPEAVVRARLEVGELLTPETCGWHYAEGLRRDDDPRLALFWDKAGRGLTDTVFSMGGHFVFFVGGAVEYVSADRWEAFLDEQERLRSAIMWSNQAEPGAPGPSGVV